MNPDGATDFDDTFFAKTLQLFWKKANGLFTFAAAFVESKKQHFTKQRMSIH